MARSRRGQPGGIAGRALEKLEERTGQTMVSAERLEQLELVEYDYRGLQRTLEDVGWTYFDYVGGSPQEISRMTRIRVVQRARYVWLNDPQAGAAVELMNDFAFGRGVPKPRAKDPVVQDVIDEAWDDPDNQTVLTSYDAQLALGTDLALQSNLFFVMYDEGEGPPKLSILRHDDVQVIVPDDERRHRALWYVVQQRPQRWNFKTNTWDVTVPSTSIKVLYYPHWRNVELAREEAESDPEKAQAWREPDENALGNGKVYHARINRYSEQQWGNPRFQRTLRWYTAYNDFVKARVDTAKAAAEFIMKKKVKGTPSQVAAEVTKAVSARSAALTGGTDFDPYLQQPPRTASWLVENESVGHEPFKLDTGSGNAAADAQQIRAPIAAAERWTQAYFGDASSSSLATATSLELPILKAVESRQEVFEGIFRWFIDRVIEKAVEDGRITEQLSPDELAQRQPAQSQAPAQPQLPPEAQVQQAIEECVAGEVEHGRRVLEVVQVRAFGEVLPLVISRDRADVTHYTLVESYEDQGQDEQDTQRDLGYDFSMPSPLRRMMTDLITAIQAIATTFDPNNTNVELSRVLLTIALGEGLEVEDPADKVEKILPSDYQDPAVVAARAAAGMNPDGAPLPQFTASPASDQAYGAGGYKNLPGSAQPAEVAMRQAVEEGLETVGRTGKRVPWPAPKLSVVGSPTEVAGGGNDSRPEPTRRQVEGKGDDFARRFNEEVVAVALDALDREDKLRSDKTGGS